MPSGSSWSRESVSLTYSNAVRLQPWLTIRIERERKKQGNRHIKMKGPRNVPSERLNVSEKHYKEGAIGLLLVGELAEIARCQRVK